MSNLFGNVPSVILLLQVWPNPPEGALYGLALLSSLAGNFPAPGQLRQSHRRRAARIISAFISAFPNTPGPEFPITIISMAFAILWLAWTGWLPWGPPGPMAE